MCTLTLQTNTLLEYTNSLMTKGAYGILLTWWNVAETHTFSWRANKYIPFNPQTQTDPNTSHVHNFFFHEGVSIFTWTDYQWIILQLHTLKELKLKDRNEAEKLKCEVCVVSKILPQSLLLADSSVIVMTSAHRVSRLLHEAAWICQTGENGQVNYKPNNLPTQTPLLSVRFELEWTWDTKMSKSVLAGARRC